MASTLYFLELFPVSIQISHFIFTRPGFKNQFAAERNGTKVFLKSASTDFTLTSYALRVHCGCSRTKAKNASKMMAIIGMELLVHISWFWSLYMIKYINKGRNHNRIPCQEVYVKWRAWYPIFGQHIPSW